jgi:hypothetical protein
MKNNINIFQTLDIDTFLTNNSFSGLLSLYAFNLSFNSRKGFTLESLAKTVDFLPDKYVMAFLVFSKSIGIIDYTTNSNSDQNLYNIISYNETLSIKIKDGVYAKGRSVDERIKDDDSNTKSWQSRIKDAETYFAN